MNLAGFNNVKLSLKRLQLNERVSKRDIRE
jgi:hypothetical protein